MSSRSDKCLSCQSRKMLTSSHASAEMNALITMSSFFFFNPKITTMEQDQPLCLFDYTDLIIKTTILWPVHLLSSNVIEE